MKEFETSKTEYLEPSFLGLKTSIKVVGGKIIETVKNTRYNVVVLLMKHPYFEHLKLNTFNMLVYWNGKPIDDNQLSRMATWMEATYDVRPSISLMYECVNQVAEDKKYNPLEEYFKGKKWDGTPRLATLLEDYFGVEPSEINRAYSLKFFVGAIRRALYSTVENPIKHDSVLVLFGRQGLRKSTSIELLAIKPEWFGDTPLDISSKDCILHINGKLL
jgi:predicted P-loop ATPase